MAGKLCKNQRTHSQRTLRGERDGKSPGFIYITGKVHNGRASQTAPELVRVERHHIYFVYLCARAWVL